MLEWHELAIIGGALVLMALAVIRPSSGMRMIMFGLLLAAVALVCSSTASLLIPPALGRLVQNGFSQQLAGHIDEYFFPLIGIAVAVFEAMPQLDPVWRLALITGFLGGLTTFSSFSAEVVGMLMSDRFGLALGTAAVHVAGSLALTWLGIRTVQHMVA